MMRTNERVVIFIDGENLKRGLKDNISEAELKKFSRTTLYRKLAAGRRTVDRRHYDAVSPDNRSKKRFLNYLENNTTTRLRLGTVHMEEAGGGRLFPVQKGVDVMLAADMLVLAMIDFYDTAIIVSNDSDFIPLINYVKQVMGKEVEGGLIKRLNKRGELIYTCHEMMKITKPIFMDEQFLRECLS